MIPSLKMKSGFEIPQVGLGTWDLRGNTCMDAARTALKLGYTHIDTAEAYGNQKEIGRAIKGADRGRLFITSKVWRENLHFDDVLESAKNTLLDLGTDYLDLLLIHWPNRTVPIEETMDAFAELVSSGIVKSVGVSNFTIRHIKEALEVSKVPISVNQVEFHPYLYQKELLEFCKKEGILLTAYSPLGQGIVVKDKVIQEIARRAGATPAQVCLSWILQKGVIVIPKSRSEERLKENMEALNVKLSNDDIATIDSLGNSNRLVNPATAEFDYA